MAVTGDTRPSVTSWRSGVALGGGLGLLFFLQLPIMNRKMRRASNPARLVCFILVTIFKGYIPVRRGIRAFRKEEEVAK